MSFIIILFVLNCFMFENNATITIKNDSEIIDKFDWIRSLNVFPILPMAAPDSTDEICKTESEHFIKSVFNLTTWAYQMWDASAKGVVGQAVGSVHNFGDFDECLSIEGPIKTQYCLAELQINVTPTKKIDKYIDKYEPYEHLANRLYYTNVDQKMRRDKAFWGLCVPKSCSNKEMENAINSYLKQYSESLSTNINYSVNIATELCQTADRKSDRFFTADIIFCVIIIILALLVFIGTLLDKPICYEITQPKNPEKPLLIQLCEAFSLRKNIKSLLKVHKTFPRLDSLFGIRLIGIVIVVSGHGTEIYNIGGPNNNKQYLYDMYTSWFYCPLLHGDLIVDLFFFISGLLITVTLLTVFEKTTTINSFLIVITRYVRLTPLYALVIFYYSTVFEKTGSGPFWKQVNEQEAQFCRENWWTNLLYINNYVNTKRMCMIESWYLPCEFHFFLAGLFILRLLKKNQRLGLSLIVILLLMSLVLPFLEVYSGSKQPTLMYYESFVANFRGDNFFQTIYIKSHLRASPYFVGMLVGYVFYKMKDSTFKLKQVTSCALTIVGLIIMLVSLSYVIVFYAPGKQYNVFESAFYASLNRFSYVVGVGIVVLALGFGKVPFLGPVLCWEPLIPLSKLAYGVYILHIQFMYETIGARRHVTHASNYVTMRQIIADIVSSFLLAFVAYLCVESPVKNIYSILCKFVKTNELKTNELQMSCTESVTNQNGGLRS